MDDAESATCFGCNLEFDTVNRRHHCRRCGLLYCDSCSSYKCLIHPAEAVYPPDWDSMLSSFDPREPLRVCRGCYDHLQPQQEELLRTTSNAAQPTEVDREAVERYLNVPIQFDMRSEIMKATHTLYNFCEDNAIEGSDSVPRELIGSAWGLAFVTTMQAGFFFSARMGSGLVIARTPDGGWSAPSAVCTAGAGWGLQIGGEVTDMLVILNSQDAVDAFASTAQLTLGTELSLALGPMGRSAETNMTAGDNGVSAVFSYAHSKGFFVGIALHACMILARPDCNERFYGKRYDVSHILSGEVDRPVGAQPLYDALGEVLKDHPHANLDNLDLSRVQIRNVDAMPAKRQLTIRSVEAKLPPQPVSDAVRATPLSEQEQIDADLALAIHLSEQESEAARTTQPSYAPTANSYATTSYQPAGSSYSTKSYQPATSSYASQPPRSSSSSSSWTNAGESSSWWWSSAPAPPPQRYDDDWDLERRDRLSTIDDDYHGAAEELRPVNTAGRLRRRPQEGTYIDEEEVTL